MRELGKYLEPALRILSLVLAGIIVYELANFAIRWNPFRGVSVPDLPALTIATNTPPGANPETHHAPALAVSGSTSAPTNVSLSATQALPVAGIASVTVSNTTHGMSAMGTNLMASAIIASTNTSTNVLAAHAAGRLETNLVRLMTGTNAGSNAAMAATNPLAVGGPLPGLHGRPGGPMGMPQMPGMSFSPFGASAMKPIVLSPAMRARVSRITESEILGPVMHPLPMALLGIAGQVAFLRSANGQTGLVKEGDSLDDLKLLKIGFNRVLIEQGGQKKELMIFSGYGGESLLPKDSTNEDTHL
jgi:hypothetical protein